MNHNASVERVGGRIHLRVKYSPEVPALCKMVPGARWSPSEKVWTYPLDWNTCLGLRDVWGKSLRVGTELASWARVAKADFEKMHAMQGADSAELVELEGVAPKLAAAVASRSFQQVGAAFIATGRRVILGDQPGMGKTLETMAGIIEAGITGPILVFAPPTAIESTWKREIEEWLGETGDTVFCAVGTKAQRQKVFTDFATSFSPAGTRVWLICNIEMVRTWVGEICGANLCKAGKSRNAIEKSQARSCEMRSAHKEITETQYPELFLVKWGAIVVDESHRALITQSTNLKKMTQVRIGMARLPLLPNGLKVALSGTPMRGKPKNFWGTLNWLRPEVYTSAWRWYETWFDVTDTGYGLNVSKDVKEGKEEAFAHEMQSIMMRRTKAECMKDLPPKTYVDVWLPMEGKQKKAYQSMAKSATAILDGKTLISNGVLAEMTRLKQFATTSGRIETTMTARVDSDGFAHIDEQNHLHPELPSNKFDWIVEFLAERGIEKDDPFGTAQVVIASQFTKVINVFAEALRNMVIEVSVLTGETKPSARAGLIADFQAGKGPRVFLLNTYAGGVSVTLDAADDLVLVDRTWIPDNEEQVEDRIHRASRIHNVTIYSLGSKGTIEEWIAEQNLSLEEIQKRLMDGSRGVDFARKLLEV